MLRDISLYINHAKGKNITMQQVLLIGPKPPPNGGMAMQAQLLYRNLSAMGVPVQFLPTNQALKPAWLNHIRIARAALRFVLYLVQLWRLMANKPVCHVLSNSGLSWYLYTMPVLWIAKVKHCRVIVNYRGGGAQSFFERHSGWALRALKKADHVIVPSVFLQEVFNHLHVACQIIPNIVVLPKQQDRSDKQDSTPFTLVVTRNLEKIYDIATIIKAFAIAKKNYPNMQLKIAGSGPEKSGLEQLAQQLAVQDAVIFCGRLNREQVQKLLQEADLLLNASLIDNMPNALLEAQAYGVPIISTNVGGIPYIVKHNDNAVLIEPEQPEAMAQAIIQLIREPSFRVQLAQNGQNNVQRFTWEQVAPKWLRLYQGEAYE